MKTAYLTFEILCMLVQVIHSYQLFNYSSNLPDDWFKWFNPKVYAGAMFCLIVDCSIVFSTVDEVWWWTITGSIILIVINCLYTYNTTEDFKQDKRRKESLYARRRQFVSYFIGVLNPTLLLIFSLLYANAK